MIRLYDYTASANCFKVRLLLALLGRPYERVPIDIFAGESSTPEYLAKNPAGRTPLLELESGEPIAESNAILLYLGEGTPFVPESLEERARVWGWLFFEQNLLEPNVGTARFWRLTGRDVGPRAGVGVAARRRRGGARRARARPDRPGVARRRRRPRSRTSRSTPTRTSRTRERSTWRPTRRSPPGSHGSSG